MTLRRRGGAFASFLQRLFRDMRSGVPMPQAWVRLAPQEPGGGDEHTPDTIFACELGDVSLG